MSLLNLLNKPDTLTAYLRDDIGEWVDNEDPDTPYRYWLPNTADITGFWCVDCYIVDEHGNVMPGENTPTAVRTDRFGAPIFIDVDED